MGKTILLPLNMLAMLLMALLAALCTACMYAGDLAADLQLQNQTPNYNMGEYQPCVLIAPDGQRYEQPFWEITYSGHDHIVEVNGVLREGLPLPCLTRLTLALDSATFCNNFVVGQEQAIVKSSLDINGSGNGNESASYPMLNNGAGVYLRSFAYNRFDIFFDHLTYMVGKEASGVWGEYILVGDVECAIPQLKQKHL